MLESLSSIKYLDIKILGGARMTFTFRDSL